MQTYTLRLIAKNVINSGPLVWSLTMNSHKWTPTDGSIYLQIYKLIRRVRYLVNTTFKNSGYFHQKLKKIITKINQWSQ